MCVSVCLWASKADAKRAAKLPAHKLAVQHAKDFYEWFEVKTYGGY